ncbi:hypothetical protein CDAR_286811 [Caerostris darwini]|uniref:Uncharacterized protein n=1 Tax=Caerostris darwini TaxID=1538125 RepID=A0AAV4RAK5_9ARAC|nr:hypothetical protein CDAR_286811 [Caerostris darwini]
MHYLQIILLISCPCHSFANSIIQIDRTLNSAKADHTTPPSEGRQPMNSDYPVLRICHPNLMQSKNLHLPRNLNTLNKELQEELHCEADSPPCRSGHHPKSNGRTHFA